MVFYYTIFTLLTLFLFSSAKIRSRNTIELEQNGVIIKKDIKIYKKKDYPITNQKIINEMNLKNAKEKELKKEENNVKKQDKEVSDNENKKYYANTVEIDNIKNELNYARSMTDEGIKSLLLTRSKSDYSNKDDISENGKFFYIQIAKQNDRESAERLKQNLSKLYHAPRISIKQKGLTGFIVYIGPYKDRQSASEDLLDCVDSGYTSSTIVEE